jgi:YgiT-type zinc finger domain-containing protein
LGTGFQDKETLMRCALCRQGDTNPGVVTAPLQRGGATVIIKGVPAEVCEICGEYYLSEDITQRVLSMAEDAVSKNVEVEILRFAA